jgi:crotonobetainyl-CoA:carnitine CoA-transferase CaiB-like acyl-CoA transferase
MAGPLTGVKVLEMTSVVLGPWACQILGDMGAEVIKVEPPRGDSNRALGPYRNHPDMAALFLTCNRNKRCIVLDLKQDSGREAALKLAAEADVVVHNFRPQAMQRLQLDYEAVKAINPNIIYCATYGYGKAGPYGAKGALDDSIQAASGAAYLQAAAFGEPRYLPTIVADKTTALTVVYAILAALFHRERTGQGQEIEVPMFETMVHFLMAEHLWGLSFEPPIGKAGYTRLMSLQRRPYKTKDGYIAVLPYMNDHWVTFCEAAGVPQLATDERFNSMGARLKNIDATYAETGKVLALRTTAEWLEIFDNTNVPTMVVNSPDDLVNDPHLQAIDFFKVVEHPTEGQIRMTDFPVNFSETQADVREMAPRLGEHSTEILAELGLSQTTIDAMLASGATQLPS